MVCCLAVKMSASFLGVRVILGSSMVSLDLFGVEAAKPTAPNGDALPPSLGRHRRSLVYYPTYSYVGHNPQQPHKSVDTS